MAMSELPEEAEPIHHSDRGCGSALENWSFAILVLLSYWPNPFTLFPKVALGSLLPLTLNADPFYLLFMAITVDPDKERNMLISTGTGKISSDDVYDHVCMLLDNTEVGRDEYSL